MDPDVGGIVRRAEAANEKIKEAIKKYENAPEGPEKDKAQQEASQAYEDAKGPIDALVKQFGDDAASQILNK